MKSTLPEGHSFLGIICASDKTPLTIGTGNHEMQPCTSVPGQTLTPMFEWKPRHTPSLLLDISLFQSLLTLLRKSNQFSAHGSITVASLLFMQNLKDVEKQGCFMTGPDGYKCVIHTPLVSWIADYPEQLLLACTAGKQLAVLTASSASMGNNSTPSTLYMGLYSMSHHLKLPPQWILWDIPTFYWICQTTFSLNGVHIPFWKDWGNADPSVFLTPDALHGWHKFFFRSSSQMRNQHHGWGWTWLSLIYPPAPALVCVPGHLVSQGWSNAQRGEHHELQKLPHCFGCRCCHCQGSVHIVSSSLSSFSRNRALFITSMTKQYMPWSRLLLIPPL